MMTILPIIGFALRLFIGGRLFWAGWRKLQAYSWWRETVDQMSVFPDAAVGPLSRMLPGVELVLGAALLVGFWSVGAAIGATVLHLVFAVVMILVLARDIDAVCGCFGPESEYPVDEQAVLFNLLSAAAALAIAFLPRMLSLDVFLDGGSE